MDLSITQVPIWVSILFILSFGTIPIFLIINVVKTTYLKCNLGGCSKISKEIGLFYFSYFLVIAIVSLTGFFTKNAIPPRIMLTAIIPLFLFYFFYIQKTEWFKLVFKQVKLEKLVLIHTFRFVGAFFFVGYFYNALPKQFAFIGGTGDIISAVLAIPVFIAIKKKMKHAKSFVWIFNIIGLLDIISVLITATVLTRQAIENNTPGIEQFGTFPFSWIPAFAPATIIFLHILIFKKLNEQKQITGYNNV